MIISSITFEGYNSILKTNWRKGKLPSVQYGFYGDKLTQQNISLEHLHPHSKGGKTELGNLVLASQETNNLRGNKDIRQFADKQTVLFYLSQFTGIRLKNFNGDAYIKSIKNTLRRLGFDIG